jgi:hypothetical protein
MYLKRPTCHPFYSFNRKGSSNLPYRIYNLALTVSKIPFSKFAGPS